MAIARERNTEGTVKENWKFESLEGIVVSAISRRAGRGFGDRHIELSIKPGKKQDRDIIKIILEKEAPRIDAGEHIRIYYKNHTEDKYFGEVVEILDEKGKPKFVYVGDEAIYTPDK